MKNTSSFARLWSYLKVYKFAVAFAIFLKILSVVMSVVEPFVLGLAITELTNNLLDMAKGVAGAQINVSYVGWVMVLYFVRAIIYEIGSYYSNYFMTNAVQATVQDMRNEMTEKINRTSVSYFDKHQFGDLLGRFTSDVETVSNALQQSFLQVVNAVFTISLVMFMVLYLNLSLALLVIISIPLTYFAANFILKKSQPYFKKQADILGEMNGFVQENLSGFNVLKLYGREEASSQDFEAITQNLQEVGFKASFISGLMMPVLNAISDLTYLLVAVIGGLQVISGQLTIGNMQAFVQYVWQVSQPIQNLTQLAGQLQSAKSSLDRIFQVLDEPGEVNDVFERLEHDLTGQVSFHDVDFQYVADKPLIRNFNLEVKPGEMVAIVGPTGAGKTTMVNLLMRFYDIQAGKITIDGVDTKAMSREEVHDAFSMVLQDTWLFEGTIRENLVFNQTDISDEAVEAATRAVGVHHFIRTLPNGYDTVLDDSVTLSVGQKQLLTIARALLKDAPLLILDEATSSVDTRTEELIQKAMDKLMEGRTSFVIAHRLSTIRNADLILVMKDGNIIEQGNHQELMSQNGFYADLYNSQFTEEVA